MSSRASWVLLGALGVAALLTGYASKPPPAPPPEGPRDPEFDGENEQVLIRNALLQMSREMAAAGWAEVSKAYLVEADAPHPGAAMRALQHIADELEKYGKLRNVDKLRRLAAKIDPVAGKAQP
jgi:hypothetical protein